MIGGDEKAMRQNHTAATGHPAEKMFEPSAVGAAVCMVGFARQHSSGRTITLHAAEPAMANRHQSANEYE